MVQGLDKEANDNNGDMVLLRAAYYDHRDVVMYLVEQGVDKEAKNDNGNTTLLLTFQKNRLDIVKYLVLQGANSNAKGKNGQTALARAIRLCDTSLVDTLLTNGAYPTLLDTNDGSAFINLLQIEASEKGQIHSMVKLMLIRGVSRLVSNNESTCAKSITGVNDLHHVAPLVGEYAAKPEPHQNE